MSVRTELQEVMEWIADLSKKEPSPPTETPSRADWRNVKSNLEDVAGDLEQARVALKEAPLKDLARDLSHEADRLALRANVLARRAPIEERKPAKKPKPKAAAKTGAGTSGASKVPADSLPSSGPATDPNAGAGGEDPADQKEKPKTAADHIQAASGTIATAYEKFEDLGNPDANTQDFENDLDLLAEMTMSLRQRFEDTVN